MKREILFRGKRTDNGEWVEGFWAVLPTDEGEPEYTVIEPIDDEICLWHRPPVDPDTVGQYTGLKDRNGKRIFEGDICIWVDNDGEYDANCKYVVSWEQEETGFYLQIYDNGEDCGLDYFGDGRDGLEIIGNIYDNPELLNHETTTRNGG